MRLRKDLFKSIFGRVVLAGALLSGCCSSLGRLARRPTTGIIATVVSLIPNGGCMKRSNILGTTAPKHVTGGMNATKRMNNWSAFSATSGESVRGGSMNGGNTTAITTVIATTATETAIEMVTGTATDPPPQFTREK